MDKIPPVASNYTKPSGLRTNPPRISDVTDFSLDQRAYHSEYGEVIISNIETFECHREISFKTKVFGVRFATHDGYTNLQNRASGLTNRVLFGSKEEMIDYLTDVTEVELFEYLRS